MSALRREASRARALTTARQGRALYFVGDAGAGEGEPAAGAGRSSGGFTISAPVGALGSAALCVACSGVSGSTATGFGTTFFFFLSASFSGASTPAGFAASGLAGGGGASAAGGFVDSDAGGFADSTAAARLNSGAPWMPVAADVIPANPIANAIIHLMVFMFMIHSSSYP